ncbi:hypothetical protein KXD40_000883 [Peronospora effusa]|uniref:SCP domain-containing protein n=1 Tax=Peronospora effusa TaxID=542832 RepID=A0A3M6VRJ0_9STRA|nr:hypothetical protein DD238_003567 [Peronospora effusa]RQM10470.1 hypothetical protein DD237_003915 [Peronospora effusa]UIZ20716.1 hypothetical protein KXD40_000883 [Peronospora effusa]CAI5700542.1 unnamed protein product [Peronospora effusa]
MRLALLAFPALATTSAMRMQTIDENPPTTTCTSVKPSEDEQMLLDAWLDAHQLNEYGCDKASDTTTLASNPCGSFESVLAFHPDRPWLPFDKSMMCSSYEQKQIDAWTQENELNPYGDPQGTAYLGGSALFNENTGDSITICEKVRRNQPTCPWLSQFVTLDVMSCNGQTPESQFPGCDQAPGATTLGGVQTPGTQMPVGGQAPGATTPGGGMNV